MGPERGRAGTRPLSPFVNVCKRMAWNVTDIPQSDSTLAVICLT